MPPIPDGITRNLPFQSAAALSPVGSLTLTTRDTSVYRWSEQGTNTQPVVLNTPDTNFRGWLVGSQKFQLHGSTETDTANISVQNISGDTIKRDAARAFSEHELIGASVVYQLVDDASEVVLLLFKGYVSDAELNDQTLDLTIEGFANWSAVRAPAFSIGVSCGLFFGSAQCGSTASMPCNQTYGSCSSVERFQGVIVQWNSSNFNPPANQISQPAPAAAYNPARTF